MEPSRAPPSTNTLEFRFFGLKQQWWKKKWKKEKKHLQSFLVPTGTRCLFISLFIFHSHSAFLAALLFSTSRVSDRAQNAVKNNWIETSFRGVPFYLITCHILQSEKTSKKNWIKTEHYPTRSRYARREQRAKGNRQWLLFLHVNILIHLSWHGWSWPAHTRLGRENEI